MLAWLSQLRLLDNDFSKKWLVLANDIGMLSERWNVIPSELTSD